MPVYPAKKKTKAKIPKQGWGFVGLMLLLSLVIHLGSALNLQWIARNRPDKSNLALKKPVKIRVIPKKSPDEREDSKKIVEVKQEPTEKPEDAKYKSFQDHKTEKETKLAKIQENKPGANVGKNNPKKQVAKQQQAEAEAQPPKPKKPKLEIAPGAGDLKFSEEQRKKEYRKLIPTSKDLARIIDAGYQQYLDDELLAADRIDINTTDYRYMGYMSSMRKAIELVWNYPMAAARKGMQGEVGVEFLIHKDGRTSRIRIIRSSGYKILDDAIVEALQLASPFSPLPQNLNKEKILITGSFRYILSSFYARSH